MYKVGKSRLKYWRVKRGFTQQQLADITGRARSKVADHENTYGDTMSLEAAFNYAMFLGVSISDLYEWRWVGHDPEPENFKNRYLSWPNHE